MGLVTAIFTLSLFGLMFGSLEALEPHESPTRTIPADMRVWSDDSTTTTTAVVLDAEVSLPPARSFAQPRQDDAVRDEDGHALPSTWCLTYEMACPTTTTIPRPKPKPKPVTTATTVPPTTTTIPVTTTTAKGEPPDDDEKPDKGKPDD